jgi:integrase
MGRKRTRNTNLPAGMRARHRKGGTFYYLDLGGKPRKELPLGKDYVVAVQKWAELRISATPRTDMITFRYVAERYQADVIPTKEPRTQKDNLKELAMLYQFFDAEPTPLDSIESIHIKQYKSWRTKTAKANAAKKNEVRVKAGKPPLPINPKLGQVRANREKALFSHIWNYAREEGLTDKTNPCTGVSSFKEDGRGVFVDDEMLARLLEHASKPLQFALRLAYLTGQRPADVYKMSETDIRDGMLFVKQGKGKAKLRVKIEGELKILIDEMVEYKRQFSVRPLALIVIENGQPMNEYTMRTRLDKAREAAGIAKEDLQFRDMRPKAATEVDEKSGTKEAQGLLGHTTEAMTTKYIRHKVGKLVKPTK